MALIVLTLGTQPASSTRRVRRKCVSVFIVRFPIRAALACKLLYRSVARSISGFSNRAAAAAPLFPPSRHFLDSFLFYIHVTPYRSAPGPRRRTRNLFTFVDTDSFVSFTLIDGGRVTKASGRDSSSSFRHRLSRTPLFTQSIRDRRSLLRDDRHSVRTTRCGIFSS